MLGVDLRRGGLQQLQGLLQLGVGSACGSCTAGCFDFAGLTTTGAVPETTFRAWCLPSSSRMALWTSSAAQGAMAVVIVVGRDQQLMGLPQVFQRGMSCRSSRRHWRRCRLGRRHINGAQEGRINKPRPQRVLKRMFILPC